MERSLDREGYDALGASLAGDFAGALNARLRAGYGHLARTIVICRHDHPVPPRLGADGLDDSVLQPDHARHRAGIGLAGLLHELAALLDEPERVRKLQRTRHDQRGILTEAQPGRGRAGAHVVLAGLFHGRDDGQARGEDRRLGDRGAIEFLLRPLEADASHVPAEGLVRFPKHPGGCGRGLGNVPAHARLLRALSREEKSNIT